MDIFTTHLIEIILIPSCCSTFHWSCFFDKNDMATLLKDSLIFNCPSCNKVFSSSRNVFREISLLNFTLSEINEKLYKNKKSGFFMEISLSTSGYIFISELINPYLKHHSSSEFDLRDALKISAILYGNLVERKIMSDLKEFISDELPIDGISLACRKCGRRFSIDDSHINAAKATTCPFCKQSQKLYKKLGNKLLALINKNIIALKNAKNEGLIVIPFSPFWEFSQ